MIKIKLFRFDISEFVYVILLIIFFISSCITKKTSEIEKLSDMNIGFKCPCELIRDTMEENNQEREINGKVRIFSCSDSVHGDKYEFQLLFNKSRQYSNDEILTAIDSTLKVKEIEHELRIILKNKGLIIKYQLARELELFG
jgi:hypothetical protein